MVLYARQPQFYIRLSSVSRTHTKMTLWTRRIWSVKISRILAIPRTSISIFVISFSNFSCFYENWIYFALKVFHNFSAHVWRVKIRNFLAATNFIHGMRKSNETAQIHATWNIPGNIRIHQISTLNDLFLGSEKKSWGSQDVLNWIFTRTWQGLETKNYADLFVWQNLFQSLFLLPSDCW